MEVQLIAVWDIEEIMNKRNAVLIDIREEEKFLKEHIPNAICVREDELLHGGYGIDKEYPMVLYCDRGNSSLLIGRELAEKGVEVYTVIGGFESYQYWKCRENREKKRE